nr:MAG TPA: hypothetical protein [Caudoviricetes sp.]
MSTEYNGIVQKSGEINLGFLFCLPGIGNQGLFRFPFTLRAYFDCLSEASWKVR